MKLNKSILFLSLAVAVAFCVFVFIIIFSAFQKVESPGKTAPLPTIIPHPLDTQPTIKNNWASEEKLIEKMGNPIPLSEKDSVIKNSIISPLYGDSGDIYSNQSVTISYLASTKLFQAEIKTLSVNQVRQEVVDWFKNKGMSQAGICNLPIEFYLNWEILNDPKIENITFDTLPPGCEATPAP